MTMKMFSMPTYLRQAKIVRIQVHKLGEKNYTVSGTKYSGNICVLIKHVWRECFDKNVYGEREIHTLSPITSPPGHFSADNI